MHSRSSLILMRETAEQVASVDQGWLMVAAEGRSGCRVRRFQAKCSVRPMNVVVLDIDPEHLLEVTASDDQQPVQALGADGPDPAFRMGVRVGGLHRRD